MNRPSLTPEELARIPTILRARRTTCAVCPKEISIHQAVKLGKPFEFTIHEHAEANGCLRYPQEVMEQDVFLEAVRGRSTGFATPRAGGRP